jgi:tRNA(Ile)-lysidine synthase
VRGRKGARQRELTEPTEPTAPAQGPISDLERRFEEHVASSGVLSGARAILAAFSGGSDSTALVALLARWAPPRGVALAAAHVEHGLRGEAGESDARASRAVAAELGIPFVLLRADVLASRRPGESLESAARRGRYAALSSEARRLAAPAVVATGHTRDDQAETALLNLGRRSGRSRGGIRERREDGVVRPLLAFTRAELRVYLSARRLAWREDETNQDERFASNAVRRRVLPALEAAAPGAGERLARAADGWSERLASLDRAIDDVLGGCDPAGPLPRPRVDALDAEQKARLLVRAAGRLSGKPPGRAQIARIVSRLAAGETFEEALAGLRLRADARIVRLLPKRRAPTAGKPTLVD